MQYRNNSKLAISVVICTYNRAELLANSLQTLCEQTINKSDYEVLVVDNNSQDSTPNLTESFCRYYPNIRYFLETRQGLSHARNRGWQEAKGLYVAYIDDDCKVPEQWLTIAMKIIDRIAPTAFGAAPSIKSETAPVPDVKAPENASPTAPAPTIPTFLLFILYLSLQSSKKPLS